jgi:F-type H+-transporting ATPase subunit b
MTIDWWTLGLQTVNVVVLVWLLKRFFWRPVAAMIEQRRAAAQALLTEAEAKHTEAAAALTKIEATRAGFTQERDAILATAHGTTEQARTALLDKAAEDAATLAASAKTAIEKERQAAEQDWSDRASRLAVDIARRLANRLDGPTVNAIFLDWMLQAVRALPAATRQSVTTLEAVSAAPLETSDQAHYRSLITAAFEAHPQITFKVDSALIAGLELYGPHFAVSNSWRADLSKILADLTHDAGR